VIGDRWSHAAMLSEVGKRTAGLQGARPRKTNLRGFTVSAPQSLTAARGRDDTIHPEVFDQLTVMIECVGSGERRQE
jgi:hypothetical protein